MEDRQANTDDKATNEHFRSRLKIGSDQKEIIERMLKHLSELERETDPSYGPPSATGKNIKALYALATAGRLVDEVAGWAVDHAIGMAIAGHEIVEYQPKPIADQADYKQRLLAADIHEHELVGGCHREAFSEFTPATAKIALLNMVRANSADLPLMLRDAVVEGLRALSFGETVPLFKATVNNNKRLFRVLRLQLKAIVFVEYRYINGMKKFEAQDEVAAAYCVNRETVRTWEKAVKRRLGTLAFSNAIAAVHHIAGLARYYSDPQGGIDPRREAQQLYGAEALKREAARYKRVLNGG